MDSKRLIMDHSSEEINAGFEDNLDQIFPDDEEELLLGIMNSDDGKEDEEQQAGSRHSIMRQETYAHKR